jgi:tetratricopeptide (TPR) repeat protein
MHTNYFECEQLFMRADELIKEKRIDEAMALLVEITQMAGDFGKAYNHLGWIYETKLGNLQKAEECYQLCIRYEPNYRPAYYNYAVVLSTSKRYKELESHLALAKSVAAIDMATINNEYAIMYEAQGLYDQAIESYKKYIAELFNDQSIDTAVAAIERCKKKRDILFKY